MPQESLELSRSEPTVKNVLLCFMVCWFVCQMDVGEEVARARVRWLVVQRQGIPHHLWHHLLVGCLFVVNNHWRVQGSETLVVEDAVEQVFHVGVLGTARPLAASAVPRVALWEMA